MKKMKVFFVIVALFFLDIVAGNPKNNGVEFNLQKSGWSCSNNYGYWKIVKSAKHCADSCEGRKRFIIGLIHGKRFCWCVTSSDGSCKEYLNSKLNTYVILNGNPENNGVEFNLQKSGWSCNNNYGRMKTFNTAQLCADSCKGHKRFIFGLKYCWCVTSSDGSCKRYRNSKLNTYVILNGNFYLQKRERSCSNNYGRWKRKKSAKLCADSCKGSKRFMYANWRVGENVLGTKDCWCVTSSDGSCKEIGNDNSDIYVIGKGNPKNNGLEFNLQKSGWACSNNYGRMKTLKTAKLCADSCKGSKRYVFGSSMCMCVTSKDGSCKEYRNPSLSIYVIGNAKKAKGSNGCSACSAQFGQIMKEIKKLRKELSKCSVIGK